jgi:hypothetical protein
MHKGFLNRTIFSAMKVSYSHSGDFAKPQGLPPTDSLTAIESISGKDPKKKKQQKPLL